jgi:hypothetical protein
MEEVESTEVARAPRPTGLHTFVDARSEEPTLVRTRKPLTLGNFYKGYTTSAERAAPFNRRQRLGR